MSFLISFLIRLFTKFLCFLYSFSKVSEEGGATRIRWNGWVDFENKQEIGDALGDAKEEEHIEERIAKRLEELGISRDDISSLPVVSRCLQLSNVKK